MGRKQSSIWRFFDKETSSAFKTPRAKCKFCSKTVSSTSNNMSTHYKNCRSIPPIIANQFCRKAASPSAAHQRNAVIAKELLKRGAQASDASAYGEAALHTAAWQGHLQSIQALLENGADVNYANEHGTALHAATQQAHEAVVEALLAKGADVDATNHSQDTPLHIAARQLNLSVVLTLWRAGADPLKQNHQGETPLSLLPEQSNAAQQMRNSPPLLTQLQQLWLHAKSSPITPQQLLSALNAEHVTSFSDIVLAHHLLLLAVRQRVLTRPQLFAFGGSRDYILENVYLPVTNFSLSDEHKFWMFGVLSYAEKKKLIRDGNVALAKLIAELRSDFHQKRLQMNSALVSIARQINSVRPRVSALEQWTNEAANSFHHLCEGQEQMFMDMKHMAASLQQLHALLQQQQRNRTLAAVLSFCLSMIPVVDGALAGATFTAAEIAFGFTVKHSSSAATTEDNEILAVDISNLQTVSALMSDQYINKLDSVARQRVEAVVEKTDFKTLPNLQQRLTDFVWELKSSEDYYDSDAEEEEDKIRHRFIALAPRCHFGKQTVTAQDAVLELQHILRLRLTQAGAGGGSVGAHDVEDVVMEQMDHGTCILDVDAFIKSFHVLKKRFPIVRRQREPPELRERFRNATRSNSVLTTKYAKRLLRSLFDNSGSETGSSQARLSFTRSCDEWNEPKLDALLADCMHDGNFIDEEGFVKVAMKVLFA